MGFRATRILILISQVAVGGMSISSNIRLNKTSVDGIIFPGRGRNYNRQRSNGNGLLITISFHVSSSVKIEKLIYVIKHPNKKGADTTLPKPLSSEVFVKRLEKELEEEMDKWRTFRGGILLALNLEPELNLSQFRDVVLETAENVADADQDIVKAWVLAVWVR